ncbi:MAG: glucosaminidase domain-containing protein, partial [Kiloniellaceae bacterium]
LRVDGVPPSLAVAQAAIESGWGTSRFAAEGNALYGQWTEEGAQGMVPANRKPGRTYAIQRFKSLSASVEAYLRNLNTHRAYRAFRRARAIQRRTGGVVRGAPLAPELRAYSQEGMKYVQTILSIIDKNGLDALDRTALAP